MHWKGWLRQLHEHAAACQEEAAGLALTRVASSGPSLQGRAKRQGRQSDSDGGHRAGTSVVPQSLQQQRP